MKTFYEISKKETTLSHPVLTVFGERDMFMHPHGDSLAIFIKMQNVIYQFLLGTEDI